MLRLRRLIQSKDWSNWEETVDRYYGSEPRTFERWANSLHQRIFSAAVTLLLTLTRGAEQ